MHRDEVVVFRELSKTFASREGVRVRALEGVSFSGAPGRVTCILGPTGSGKSTLLRIASGLESPSAGEVRVGGRLPAALAGTIAYLTQRHTLFPWMRVRDNVGLPLTLAAGRSQGGSQSVEEICALLGLEDALDLYPYELSGGMQQRAALGRLLVSRAPYWFLDEPFSALDERTRHHLQDVFLTLVREHDLSVLFVTHSIDEAVYLADRIVVLSASPGRVVEVFDPDLPRPRNRLAPAYGELIELIRRRMESALAEQ